jgi:hypothetical protein
MVAFNLTPEFVYDTTQNFQTIQTPFESGATQLRAKWARPKRRWTLRWKNATPAEMEELRAFYRDHKGPAVTFSYTPTEKIPRPTFAPTTGQEEGPTEALEYRIYYAGYTWSDSSDNETQVSLNTATQIVDASYLLTVTVPAFPNNVDKAWIYVGTSANTKYKQATAVTTSGGTWTEPAGGYDSGGDAQPTSNALSETVTAHFVADSFKGTKVSAYIYTMQIEIEEVLNL